MELKYPDDFRCPISLEPMSDPVILTSGHTFDRRSIQRWIDSGHHTCPLTNLPLPPHSPLIPNHALRSLIHSSNPNPSPSPNQSSLLSSLSFPSSSQTLSSLFLLSKSDPSFRRSVLESSAPSILLRHASSAESPDLQNLALRTLLHLSMDGDDARVGLVADGAIDSLTSALGGPSAFLAATVLTSLAVVEVNKCSIGAHPSAIRALCVLLCGGKGRERREAATALYELCKLAGNRGRVVRSGAVHGLVCLAGEGSERAVRVLGLIAKCGEGRERMGGVEGFVGVMKGVLEGGRGVEDAILVMSLVCGGVERVRREAREEGVVEICLGIGGRDGGKVGRSALDLARIVGEGVS